MSNIESWDRMAGRIGGAAEPADVIRYGPDSPTEHDLHLLGDIRGKRVLDLGAGDGRSAVAFAKQGATVISVGLSLAQIGQGRKLAAREDVRIEWHQGDLADLAFLGADSIELAFSSDTFAFIEGLGRIFRQVHRVLKPHSLFVFSYEHPFASTVERDAPSAATPGALALGNLIVKHSYFDTTPLSVERNGEQFLLYPRSIADVLSRLHRAGFRVDSVSEPVPVSRESSPLVPSTIIWRARKEGA